MRHKGVGFNQGFHTHQQTINPIRLANLRPTKKQNPAKVPSTLAGSLLLALGNARCPLAALGSPSESPPIRLSAAPRQKAYASATFTTFPRPNGPRGPG